MRNQPSFVIKFVDKSDMGVIDVSDGTIIGKKADYDDTCTETLASVTASVFISPCAL